MDISNLSKYISESILKEIALLNEVNKDFEVSLVESYGISAEVEKATSEIKNEIIKKSKENAWQEKGGIKIQNGTFEFLVFDTTMTINYSIINFITEKNFDALWQNFDFGAEYKPKRNLLAVNIGMYNGQYITSTFDSSLQHELTHLYDNIKTGGYTFSDKEAVLYKKIVQLLSSEYRPFDEKVYDIGWCLYYSFKSERMAFANDFYAKIKQNISIAKQTDEFNALYFLKHVLNKWAEYEKYTSIFEITPQKCYIIINNGYKELARALGRAYTKAKIESINEGTMLEPRRNKKPLKIFSNN